MAIRNLTHFEQLSKNRYLQFPVLQFDTFLTIIKIRHIRFGDSRLDVYLKIFQKLSFPIWRFAIRRIFENFSKIVIFDLAIRD